MRILLLGFSKKSSYYEVKRLVRELKKRGHTVTYMFWGGLIFSFSKKGLSIKRPKGTDLKYYDFIIPRAPRFTQKTEKKIYLSQLYRHYLLIVDYINRYHKHVLNEKTTKKMPFYDKLFQHYLLSKNGLPVIPSVLYTGRQTPDSVYKKFKKPYVTKSIEGSRGKQVFLVKKDKEVESLIEDFGAGNLLVQKHIPTTEDYRIIVIGNKVVGGMRRKAVGGDFRANVSLGGEVEKIKVTKEFSQLAKRAAKVFNAEYAGVDIIKYKGKLYVLEVNIFAGFEGFETATKINVAEELAKYIEKKYLWSIDTDLSKEEKNEMFNSLYKIEKQNIEEPLNEKVFKKEVKKNRFIIVKKEKKPIAYLSSFEKNNIRYVSRLVVSPEYLGQRIGRRMLRELISQAKQNKEIAIRAVINQSNKKRQKTLRAVGFKKILNEEKLKAENAADEEVVFEYKISPTKKTRGGGFTRSKKAA